jgi:tRNA-specific 2-thiouridylase
VALLLSGGVDSSVALALLKQSQQYDITAFYLRIWLADELSHLNECPWQEDYRVCEQVCNHLNVPLETVSLQEEYQNTVLNYTLTQAQNGRTPNPDVLCNSRIKFGCFYDYAIRTRNFDYVASGHYAQVQHSKDGNVKLLRSPDPIKDQSYFLCTLSQAQLRHVLFPVGQYPKSEIRKLADETFRLPNRHRRDSQGLCFLGKFKFDEFLSGQLKDRPGDIVDAATGSLLGRHRGIWYHTVGQRKGLGKYLHPHATALGPWYVVAKEPSRNIVYCSNAYDDDQLFAQARRQFTVENLHWIAGQAPERRMEERKNPSDPENSIIYTHFTMKIRHGPKLVTGMLMLEDETSSVGDVILDAKDSGLAPGQYVAFYDGIECVGAGVISERHWTRFLEDPLRLNYVAATG